MLPLSLAGQKGKVRMAHVVRQASRPYAILLVRVDETYFEVAEDDDSEGKQDKKVQGLA
jgi:hypothetical protein